MKTLAAALALTFLVWWLLITALPGQVQHRPKASPELSGVVTKTTFIAADSPPRGDIAFPGETEKPKISAEAVPGETQAGILVEATETPHPSTISASSTNIISNETIQRAFVARGRFAGPRRDWITITNGVIWPIPTGAAWINVTAPTQLKLADFPDGAMLDLALINLSNFPVYLDFRTNVFFLTGPLQGESRYLLRLQNVRGELWITK